MVCSSELDGAGDRASRDGFHNGNMNRGEASYSGEVYSCPVGAWSGRRGCMP